jgi:dTDP-4-dehydrorhamnose 3,5-epimerase
VKVIRTEIPDVLVVEPRVFEDERGITFESFNRRAFKEATGVDLPVAQENVSRSRKNVIRGLHYQVCQPQGKLIGVLAGDIFDVAVDLRRSAPTFRRWVGVTLSADSRRRMWIPPGFAHGFLVLSESAEVVYKLSDFWAPEHERSIVWNDPELAIAWPLSGEPIVSAKDHAGKRLAEAEPFA